MDRVDEVAAILSTEFARIRDDWRARVMGDPELPTEELTACEIEDDIPSLLSRIVVAIQEFGRRRDDAEARGELAGSGPPSVNHLRLRLREGYSVRQVLRELHHLRETIVVACESKPCSLTGDAARIVHASIDAAMMIAVVQR